LPRNLHFIDPHVPETPGDVTPKFEAQDPLETKNVRLGKLGEVQKALPDVHAEASDYYGGKEVWSRARTFSNVGCGTARLLMIGWRPRVH
jgi:hypothetical protein